MRIEDVDNRTAAELLADSGLFGAISIDTNVYDGLKGSFESGLLKQLEQFSGGYPITLLMPEVVREETMRHLIDRADTSARDLKKAMKAVGFGLGFSRENQVATLSQALNGCQPVDIAKSRFEKFVAATGTTIVGPTGFVDVSELQRRYFEAVPPFSSTGDKKAEFPDAIALLTLEGWAQQHNKHVLVVSHDGDWSSFCTTSRWLHIIGDLAHAIALFQHVAGANRFAENIETWINGSPDWVRVESRVSDELWSFSVSIDAESEYYFEDELIDIKLKSIHPPDTGGVVISANENVWVIELLLRAEIELESDFSFSVRDGVDKDYVPIGSTRAYANPTIDLSLVLTFTPADDESHNPPELEDIEIATTRIKANFGYVSPDY